MITINTSTKEEIKDFNAKEWKTADEKYYGKHEPWLEEDFVFKAEEDGKIVGNIYGKFATGTLYIDDLIVSPDKRGSGIGKMLMQKAEDFGLALHAHKAFLVTGKDWSEARKFYESLGYKKTGDFVKHYHKADFVIYEKFFQD
jgi:ribosomal protein S18 acetylase RimI-like enzyme